MPYFGMFSALFCHVMSVARHYHQIEPIPGLTYPISAKKGKIQTLFQTRMLKKLCHLEWYVITHIWKWFAGWLAARLQNSWHTQNFGMPHPQQTKPPSPLNNVGQTWNDHTTGKIGRHWLVNGMLFSFSLKLIKKMLKFGSVQTHGGYLPSI